MRFTSTNEIFESIRIPPILSALVRDADSTYQKNHLKIGRVAYVALSELYSSNLSHLYVSVSLSSLIAFVEVLVPFWVFFGSFLCVFGSFLGFENIVGGAQSVVNGTQKKGGPYVLQLGVTRISGPY